MRIRDSAARLWLVPGIALVLVALFLPTGWYDEIPQPREDLPEPPVRGVTLLRICFLLEGAILLALGLFGVSWPGRGGAREPPEGATGRHLGLGPPPPSWSAGRTAVVLGGITVLGAWLRLRRLGGDLWLDEITTVLDYRNVSAFHVLTAFPSSNNQLLNTLLVKGALEIWGPEEWAIRLPAALFGILGIPAIYLLARVVMDRRLSLLTALLLAVSYHHVYFSQNARGYTAYLLGSTLGTWFLCKVLAHGRIRDCVGYVASMLLAAASVLIGFFVVAGHVLAFGVVAWQSRRRGRPVRPLARRMVAVWGVFGLLGFHLYASVVPQVWVYMQPVYTARAVGYSPFSAEYYMELLRGLSQGFAGGSPAVALAAVSAILLAAAISLVRRPVVVSILLSPLVVTVGFLLVADLRFSPRFFLWSLPVAFLLLVDGVAGAARRAAGGGSSARAPTVAALATVAAVAALSAPSLVRYYRVPKQPTRTAVEWVDGQRRPGDVVVTAYLAKWAFRFYGPPRGLDEGEEFRVVQSVEELRRIEAEVDHRGEGGGIWLVTTFPRALRFEFPELHEAIDAGYRRVKTFPATIGDGEYTVWRPGKG